MEPRTLTTKRGMSITTTLSDKDAVLVLSTMNDNFAADLYRKYVRYGLSADQMAWVHKLAMGTITPAAATETINVGSMAGLIALFDKAKEKLKFPKIRLTTPAGNPLCLAVAGERSKYSGQIHVTDGGKFGLNRYYGRISRDGVFTPSQNGNDPALVDFLKQFAADPAKVAGEYGRLSGNCCFCNKALDDERSTKAGYGPVCAKNYGLDWGTRKGWNSPGYLAVEDVPEASSDDSGRVDYEEQELAEAGLL